MLAVGAKGNLLENLPPELILTENVALPYFLCVSSVVFSESFPLFNPSLVGLLLVLTFTYSAPLGSNGLNLSHGSSYIF